MKLLVSFLFTFCTVLSFAQTPITITNSSAPNSGDTLRYSASSPNAIVYAPTGTNYFWDYSTLTMVTQDVLNYKAAFQTPYAFYFIGANKYGIKIADSVGFGTFKFYDVYNYFQKTNTVFKTEGTGFKYQGIPLAAFYSDDDELYQFPLNYLDRDSSTYHVSIALGATISYDQKGYRINEVDGWGSIKTPYDSLACLRLISTQYGIDSINFNGFGFSFPNIQRSYKWLANNERIPILEISGQYTNNNFTPTQVRYRDRYPVVPVGLQTNNINNESIVYPNPSNGLFIISIADNLSGIVSIIDVSGKLVYTKNCEAGNTAIDLNSLNLSKGIYCISMVDESSKTILTKKIVID